MLTSEMIYAEASRIIVIAMGSETVSRGRGRKSLKVWKAEYDPLAHWLGVELIVDLVQRANSMQAKP